MTFKTLQNRTSQNSRTVKRLQDGERYQYFEKNTNNIL